MNKLFSVFVMVAMLAACSDKKNNDTNNTETANNTEVTNNPANKTKEAQASAFTNIEPATFKQLISDKAGVVLDVRTPAEVAKGKLPKATHIDFYKDDFDTQVAKIDKTKPIYVYCAVGGRSGKAMQKMKAAGFKEVYNLAGGFNAWKKSGYTIEK